MVTVQYQMSLIVHKTTDFLQDPPKQQREEVASRESLTIHGSSGSLVNETSPRPVAAHKYPSLYFGRRTWQIDIGRSRLCVLDAYCCISLFLEEQGMNRVSVGNLQMFSTVVCSAVIFKWELYSKID